VYFIKWNHGTLLHRSCPCLRLIYLVWWIAGGRSLAADGFAACRVPLRNTQTISIRLFVMIYVYQTEFVVKKLDKVYSTMTVPDIRSRSTPTWKSWTIVDIRTEIRTASSSFLNILCTAPVTSLQFFDTIYLLRHENLGQSWIWPVLRSILLSNHSWSSILGTAPVISLRFFGTIYYDMKLLGNRGYPSRDPYCFVSFCSQQWLPSKNVHWKP
jgi:hypothetical protein